MKISIEASSTYDVIIDRGILKDSGALLAEKIRPCGAAIITDDNVERLYGAEVMGSLEQAGFEPALYAFKNGESSKNLSTFGDILEYLAERHITRADIIIALGGGVVGDMGGFAAAAYQRGASRFVQIPTTFLAGIDSSIGGKSGVNLKSGKNLAGAFIQPEMVICDVDTFGTLPEEVFSDGISEAIKYGVIADRALFDLIAGGGIKTDVLRVAARCAEIKGRIVSADEFDRGLRRILNFGHTIGHALETLSGYRITHGHGVGIGMTLMSRAAERLGLCKEDCAEPIKGALLSYGLPVDCPYGKDEILNAMLSDKKRTGDEITLALPLRIGKCILKTVPLSRLGDYLE